MKVYVNGDEREVEATSEIEAIWKVVTEILRPNLPLGRLPVTPLYLGFEDEEDWQWVAEYDWTTADNEVEKFSVEIRKEAT